MTTQTTGAAELPEALTEDQWLDLAQRHVTADWNSDGPDGFLNAVKAVCADYHAQVEALSAAQAGVPTGTGKSPDAESLNYIALLAECRDAFPIPGIGSPLEDHWMSAMGDPTDVPGYLRAVSEAMQDRAAKADALDVPHVYELRVKNRDGSWTPFVRLGGGLVHPEVEVRIADEPTATAATADAMDARPSPAPADQQPGDNNAQLATDSDPTTPGQQRCMAGTLEMGQPVGNGQHEAGRHTQAQGDKLLAVAERNLRRFLETAVFRDEADRQAALNCLEVLTTSAPAQPGQEGERDMEDDQCRCEPCDYVRPADYDGDGSVSAMARRAARAAPQPATADAVDEAFEAVRKAFCKLQRYSFFLDKNGNVARVPRYTGNWVQFHEVHTLFDPAAVDAALAAQREVKP